MFKLSESALVPKIFSATGKKLLGIKSAIKQIAAKPVKDFSATQSVAKEHPLINFKEDATRGIVAHKKGLIGKPTNQMHDWHSKRSAPVRTQDPKPDFHPTKPTTDTVDWHHKVEPTNSTYKKIKKAIAA